jgi:crotonobetainyl-CoA:carnitine CoA-transferase CaiB-like acyl-CoA transferase
METQNAAVLDPAVIITRITSVKEVRALPVGTLVGDLHGGLTFTDAVAAALECRSTSGWQEAHGPAGEIWTIIAISR